MNIGDTLRASRLRSGLTLRELAARAGTSHSALAVYESGAKVPRADTMYRVLEAAGWNVVVTSMDELRWEERVERGELLEALLRLTDQFPTRRGEAPRSDSVQCGEPVGVRGKDWVDLEEMVRFGSLDAPSVLGTLTLYLGGDDHRIARLRDLVRHGPEPVRDWREGLRKRD